MSFSGKSSEGSLGHSQPPTRCTSKRASGLIAECHLGQLIWLDESMLPSFKKPLSVSLPCPLLFKISLFIHKCKSKVQRMKGEADSLCPPSAVRTSRYLEKLLHPNSLCSRFQPQNIIPGQAQVNYKFTSLFLVYPWEIGTPTCTKTCSAF